MIAECHQLVWTWRSHIEEHFPAPTRHHSLLFAVTEAGEALEAILRQSNRYKRRSQKKHSEITEWTQCAMMLLTALGPELPASQHTYYLVFDVESLVLGVSTALWRYQAGNYEKDCLNALASIIRYLHDQFTVDLRYTLEEELARLSLIHVPIGEPV